VAESVGAVHVEFTASTAGYRAELDKGKQAVWQFAKTNKEAVQSVAQGASATGTFTTKLGKLGDQIKGAAGSVSLFANAASAMGDKVSPAIRGLGTAIGSLAMGGFTPLGIALGAATVAIGLFNAEAGKVDEGLKPLEGRLVSVRQEIAKLNDELLALRTGGDFGSITNTREIAEAQKELDELRAKYVKLRDTIVDDPLTGEPIRLITIDEEMKAEADALVARMAVLAKIRDSLAEKGGKESEVQQIKKDTDDATKATAELRKEWEMFFDIGADSAARFEKSIERFQAVKDWWAENRGFDTSPTFGGAEPSFPNLVEMSPEDQERIAAEGKQIEETLEEIGEVAALTTDDIATGFGDAFAEFVTGTMNAKEAFDSFATAVIADTLRILASQAAVSALTSFLGGGSVVVPSVSSGTRSASVGGSNGTNKSMQVVNVYEAPGTKATVEKRMGPAGPQIDVVIESVVAQSIEGGGRLDRVLRDRGLPRRGRHG